MLLLVFINLIFKKTWTDIQRFVFVLYIDLNENDVMEPRFRLWNLAITVLELSI